MRVLSLTFLFSGCTAVLAECPVLHPMPDIHVCEGGSALLSPVIEGSFSKMEWAGGKGTVSETEPGIFEYVPGETESEGEIRLTLTASPDKGCPVQTQSVLLTMDKMPELEVTDLRRCQGKPVIMEPTIKSKYDSLVWSTSGTGSFERPAFPQSAYSPSDADVKSDGVLLTAKLYNGICPAAEGTARLLIDELPNAKISATRRRDLYELTVVSDKAEKVKWSHYGSGRLRSDS
ncbi:MAG: hypothetical protein ACKOKF_11255, partial [Bacteroidota bacterium]